MAWYSTISDFATKQFVANQPYDPSEEEEGPFEEANGAAAPGAFLLSSSEAAGPRQSLSSAFFKPSGINWAPSEADEIYAAFDVSQPVAEPQDLCGRDQELGRLLSGVLHRRNHGVVSGPRGSGKTSLVRVFGQHADREGVVVLYAACDSGTSFGALLHDFLEQVPASSVDADYVDVLERRVANFGPESSPHQATSILAQIKYSQVIFIVDEFDRVSDAVMQSKMASLLKLISDARLQVRVVLVGGNSAFTNIFSQHPSMVRHITRLSTEPLSKDAIHEVLDGCAARCGRTFSKSAKDLLEQVACGSPYHARLFGMHAALCALEGGANEIGNDAVLAGLAASFEEWATLNQEDAATFRAIIDGAHGDPATYVKIARQLAAADEGADKSTVPAARLRQAGQHDQILSAFGSAVERFDGHVGFRDATAPQFFLALEKLSRPASAARRSKGKADV